MDVKLWGPSAWRLFHMIAETYNPTNKKNVHDFFMNLKSILPCIYCRESIGKFLKKSPITPSLENAEKFQLWLYNLHNKVNKKLRDQGNKIAPDPDFTEVKEFYLKNIVNFCQHMPGWDFLFSIAFNYPQDTEHISQEVQDTHYRFFCNLFESLPDCNYKVDILEFCKKNDLKSALTSAPKFIKWMYRLYKKTHCGRLHIKEPAYKKLCKRFESFRSSCIKKTFKGNTCRSSHTVRHRKTRKNQKIFN